MKFRNGKRGEWKPVKVSSTAGILTLKSDNTVEILFEGFDERAELAAELIGKMPAGHFAGNKRLVALAKMILAVN